MKLSLKKKICVMTAVVSAFAFTGCSAEPGESAFDNPLPWHDAVSGSYEKLDYSLAVFDTTPSGATERIQIADGQMSFELIERQNGYTELNMDFTVTYRADAPAPDAGLTDSISSKVTFETNSLASRDMHKEMKLAAREGQINRSYVIDADYFGSRTAKFKYTAIEGAAEQIVALPQNICHDNEMMIYLARAQAVAAGSSTMFKMVNVFDSANGGELAQYPMVVTGSETKQTLDIGDWVRDFGVAAVTDEQSGATSYPISCVYATININEERHGPPYFVYFAEAPFKSNDKSHGKVPIRIGYNQYNGSKPYRTTEYTLTGCTFDRAGA